MSRNREQALGQDEARAAADLAVFIAERIPTGRPAESGWLANLRAYAWAHLAHAGEVCGNHSEAMKALRHTAVWLEEGEATGNDLFGYGATIALLLQG